MYKEIDVIHPIMNISGLGITDGNIEQMIEEVTKFKLSGRGVFSMKPLGGGNLLNRVDDSFNFMFKQDCVDSIAVGMQSIDEVVANVMRFSGEKINYDLQNRLNNQSRKLHIDDWCTKCCKCVEKCSHNALSKQEGKIQVDRNKCVLCGYCAAVCEEFCIKVV